MRLIVELTRWVNSRSSIFFTFVGLKFLIVSLVWQLGHANYSTWSNLGFADYSSFQSYALD